MVNTAPITLATLCQRKTDTKKFSMLTAYDASFTLAMNQAGIDCILVGDSLGMLVQGHDSTLPVHIAHMVYHTRNVARANTRCFLLADMPFMSAPDASATQTHAARLMRAGAHMVKLEYQPNLADSIAQLKAQGVPTCVHFGLTPQHVHRLGGYKVQGKTQKSAHDMRKQTQTIIKAGADMLLLECVPAALAAMITQQASVPVVGIGAGGATDGQVLVMHDMLGLSARVPRFVKNFLPLGDGSIVSAFATYHRAVISGAFPEKCHEYTAA